MELSPGFILFLINMFSKTGVDDPIVLICNKQRPNIKYYLFVSEGSEEIYTRNPFLNRKKVLTKLTLNKSERA